MSTMTQKSFAAGSPCPPLKPGMLRLYSMRFCPYAQRTRLVLAHKGIPFETVNVHLKEKPDWFLEKNPLGLVPILEIDDKIVYESTATCEWLDDIYPEKRLQPSDPFRKAQDRMLLEYFGKVTIGYYSMIRAPAEERTQIIENLLKHYKYYDEVMAKRGGPFLGGTSPAMIDFFIWPHLERVPVCAEYYDSRLAITKEKFPALSAWFDKMYTLPAVKETMFDNAAHFQFLKGFVTQNPDYDFGLED